MATVSVPFTHLSDAQLEAIIDACEAQTTPAICNIYADGTFRILPKIDRAAVAILDAPAGTAAHWS